MYNFHVQLSPICLPSELKALGVYLAKEDAIAGWSLPELPGGMFAGIRPQNPLQLVIDAPDKERVLTKLGSFPIVDQVRIWERR